MTERDECRTKEAFQHVTRMLLVSRSIVKFCTTNSVFNYLHFSALYTHTCTDYNIVSILAYF